MPTCRPADTNQVAAHAEHVHAPGQNSSSRRPAAKLTPDVVRTLTAHVPVGLFVTNTAGECEYTNDRLCELSGLTQDETLGFGWAAALHPDDAERVTAAWTSAAATGKDFALEYRFLRPDGRVVWVQGSASVVCDERGVPVAWVGVCVDLTERRESDERYRDLVEHARDGVFTADLEGRFTSVNPAAEEITGFRREELLGRSLFDLIDPENAERAQAALARAFAGEPDEFVELWLVAKDGRRVFVEVSGRVVEHDGQPIRIEGIARDITERHALQAELAQQAFYDSLTGLPNRELFLDRLGQALARAERPDSRIAVMLLDLDNFKLVNDSLGHAVGDELLVAIAPRLADAMRGSDTVARLGGDEFAFLVEGTRDDHETVTLAERVLAAFDEPFTLGTRTQRIGASLGVAVGARGDTPDGLLRKADTAMYRAKAKRQSGFELYDDAMHRRARRELAVRNALADAVQGDTGELCLYYQPIVSLADGGLLGIEALSRWLHPQWGWVTPGEFVPIAESDTLISSLGERVLGDAIGHAAVWRCYCRHALPLGVSVNVSPRELARPDFVPYVARLLRAQDVTPAELAIEVTERLFVDERDPVATDNLAELGRLGVRLSLDDFGTGYSGLASLSRFPFSSLKIDRSFIRAIRRPADTAPLAAAVVSLGRAFGLTVVGEGVENELQADYLRRLGCDAAQDFHYARPMPAGKLTAYLSEWSGPGFERSVA
jgi:diguanylate cyclase (GGDEF)-like protein/PAS domain S-box-containing protein